MGRPRGEFSQAFCPECNKELLPEPYISQGRVKGWRQRKYCSKDCYAVAASRMWRGTGKGRYVDKAGYIILRRDRDGYMQPEHRAVMEKMIGRPLKAHETIHHKDGNRQNNAPENLELWSTRHGKGQRVEDKIAFCIEFLREYGFEVVAPAGALDIGSLGYYNRN